MIKKEYDSPNFELIELKLTNVLNTSAMTPATPEDPTKVIDDNPVEGGFDIP